MTTDWNFYSLEGRLLLSDLDQVLHDALAKNQEIRTVVESLVRHTFDVEAENKVLRQLVRDLYASPQDEEVRQKARDWLGEQAL